MTARAHVAWPVGLAASALINAGALAGLALVLAPRPVPVPPRPTSTLDVAAYHLERSQATAVAPDARQTEQADAPTTSVDQGAIPQDIGHPVAATAAPLPAALATPTPSDASLPPALALPASDTAGAPILSAQPSFSGLSAAAPQNARLPDSAPRLSTATATDLPPAATPSEPQIPAPSVLDPARPAFSVASTAEAPATGLPPTRPLAEGIDATRLAAFTSHAALPDALPLDTARPAQTTSIAAQVTPDRASAAQPAAAQVEAAQASVTRAAPALGQATLATSGTARLDAANTVSVTARPAAVAQSGAQTAAPIPPDPVRMQAALAFQGGDGDIDPLSLAAFQSFVAPGSTSTNDSPLRDGLVGLLAAVPCSRLQIVFDPDTARLRIDGHIPQDGLRDEILTALQSEMGDDIGVSDNMALLPRPQCGALAGIADVDLPQSTDQITNPLLIGETLHARALRFTDGDLLYFDLTAPDYDAYVYVDYFDADGNVVHLSPNPNAPLIFARQETTFRVGAATASDPGLKMFVAPPFGQEIAVAFAASRPLYQDLRPVVEPAEPYLDWLKTQVAQARLQDPDFKGEWVYFFVTTAAQ